MTVPSFEAVYDEDVMHVAGSLSNVWTWPPNLKPSVF